MASSSSFLSEEHFQCSICLDVFTEPVSTPCGHTFCKTCITTYWDNCALCQCPLCKQTFHKRPRLSVNIVTSDMAAQFRKSVAERSSPEQQAARPGEVSCDICTEKKIKAVKSCLMCLASYCQTHLEPHLRVASFKKHKLINPVENLEDRMCKKHGRPLELFCSTEQVCVCQFCAEMDHKTHDTVPLEVQQMIQEREQKIQHIQHSVDLSRNETKREMADSAEVFTALVASVERSQAKLVELMEEKQRAAEERAEGFIKELEQEISELKKRSTELEQLSHTEDHLLHSSPSLSTPPPTKDWSGLSVHSGVNVGRVRRAVAEVEETLREEMEKLLDAEPKWIQQYAVDVTLDPDTAYPRLILSDDGKQVKCCDTWKNLPDNPERFTRSVCVLAKQSFSSGRFYYEVQVKDKTTWVLGVVRESIDRKGIVSWTTEGGYWCIALLNGQYYGSTDVLSLREKPQVIGVFVDYEEGQVSFYDAETRAHIYSHTGCTFTEKLYPLFSPGVKEGGENTAPLIICPLKLQE